MKVQCNLHTEPRNFSDVPLDMPLSISELALLPRKPVLLLLCPSLLPLRISLFRVITGVSAKGSIILCALGSRFFATVSSFCVGVFAPTRAVFCSGCASGAGVICFFLSFSTGAVFLVRFAAEGSVGFGRTSSCSRSPERRVERRRFCVSEVSVSMTAIAAFFRRAVGLAGSGSCERAGLAGGSSGMGSAAGTACAFVVLRDVRRENWKPSSSSSYAAFAVFFTAPVARFVVPFTSARGRLGAGASSSSKACLALRRRVVGRLAAMGSDCRGERAKMVVMSPVVACSWVRSKRVHGRTNASSVGDMAVRACNSALQRV
jgi:hypothetical protein